jgi:hypothetical protein
MDQAPATHKAAGSRVGWWFAAAALAYLLAWATWFAIAARHPVAEVPLARSPGH